MTFLQPAEHRAEQAPMHDRIPRPLSAAVSAPGRDLEDASVAAPSYGLRASPPAAKLLCSLTESFQTKAVLNLTAPTDGGAVLYVHAGVRSRTDCASVEQLVADGWTVEHTNVWGGALMRKEIA